MTIIKKPVQLKSSLKADKKRGDIVKAARSCFRKNGFHQTSMQEVCTAVGLGPGAVYRYFDSKQAIIEAMAQVELRASRSIEHVVQHADDFNDALHSMTQAFLQRHDFAADASMLTEVYAEGMRNKRVGSIVKKVEDDWITLLATMVRTAQARGQVDVHIDARQTALFVTALWDGMMIRQVFHRQSKSDSMIAFFEAMLGKCLLRENKRNKISRSTEEDIDGDANASFEKADDDDARQLSLI